MTSRSKIKITFQTLTAVWLVAATYFALKSPEGLKLKQFTKGFFETKSSAVSVVDGTPFVKDLLQRIYLDDDISPKFLLKTLSSKVSEDLFESMRPDLERSLANREKLSRKFYLEQLSYDESSELYTASLSFKRDETASKKIYLLVEMGLKLSNDSLSSVKLNRWTERPSPKRPSQFLEDRIYLSSKVSSKIELPCKVSSIRLKSPLKGLETKIKSSGEVVEFMTLEPLQSPNSYISKCGSRTFTNNLEPATNQITIFRRVGLKEGRLPKKVLTTEERIAEGIMKWEKERTKSHN